MELCIRRKLLFGCSFNFSYLFIIYLVWVYNRVLKVWEYIKRSFRALSRVRKAIIRIIVTDIIRAFCYKNCDSPTSCHCSLHPESILGGPEQQGQLCVRQHKGHQLLGHPRSEQLVCTATGRTHNQSGQQAHSHPLLRQFSCLIFLFQKPIPAITITHFSKNC